MGKVVDALIDGTPLGKLVWNAVGVDAWWEIGVGKYIREALIPVPDTSFNNDALGQQQMVRSPIEPRRSIYGRAMVSGPMTYVNESGKDNEFLHIVIPLASHRCTAIEEIYFNDELVYSNGQLDDKYKNHARVKIHLGEQTSADTDLVAECSNWTANHIGVGITYLYVRLKHDPEFFTEGLPNVKALVKGKPVYDPRLDSTMGGVGAHRLDDPTSWSWSDNWALCVLDYTLFESGVGALPSEVDFTSYALAANDSDVLIEYDDEGHTEKRYTCNGTFTQAMTPASVLDKLLTAGAGMQSYLSGKYQLFAGVYQGPYMLEIGEDDLAGNIEIRPFNPRANLCNAVRGTFVDPTNFYQPTDFPPYESSYYRAQDSDEYIDHDVDLPFTQSLFTAQRLAKLYLELNRGAKQIVLPLNMIGLSVSVGKVVKLNLPRLGINGEYQVVDWDFDFGQPCKVTLRETAIALYEYDRGSYTTRPLTPPLNLPSAKNVPTVSGLVWTALGDDANYQGTLTWMAPGGNSAYRYRIEITDTQQRLVYQTSVEGTLHNIPKLDVGTYTISIWAVNLFANRSNIPATLVIGADAPPTLTSIQVDAGALELVIRPQTAALIAQTTVFEVVGGLSNQFIHALPIGQGKEVIWPSLHANTIYYVWARAINNFGAGSWFGPVAAQTTADKSALVELLGDTFKSFTWFAWADDNQGTGFTTVEALGDGKAYMGIATDKDTASPSGNWQEYTWTKIKTEIPPVFTPEEEAKLDNLMAGKLPFAPDKDMLAAQDALNNPALANNLITALSLLNQGINAPALGGETPSGAQSKASSAQSAAIAASATDATTKANNAKAAAESYALAKANLAETTAKAYADGIVSDEEARAIADAQAKADAAKAAAISAAAVDATSKANNAKAQAEANAALDALNKATTAKTDAITTAASDATTKANNAKAAAESYALAKANLAETTAKAYADGIVSDEEARAIADAQAKADAAKAAAIAASAADATTKANNAKAQAEANAALDALNKANTAKADAISTASTDATTKANNAKTQAISSAATDATTKADAAKSAAIAAAAADATNKANNARAQAEANAALDALNKATTAKADAISTASTDATNKIGALKIGGTNLVENSLINANSTSYGFANRVVNLVSGREYVFSAAGYVSQKALDEGHNLVIYIYKPDWSFSKALSISTLSESVKDLTFIAPSTGSYSINSYLYPNGGTRTGTVHCSWYKLEEGNKPTAWAPAPVDLENYASNQAAQAQSNATASAALDALNKANAAKADAISTASTDATTKANNAKTQAISSAATDATTKADAAKAAAIAAAAADATTKANNAKAQAEANAALDALNKANTAKADAISTAATDATTKANNAQSAAIAAAAADATTKANNAKAQAEANAALDAINKANAAKTDAISTAATDATAKANSALTAANAELNNRINAAEAAALDNLFSISGLPYRKDIVIGGDSNKYYPVVFWGGSQDVNRRIKIWRGYNEQAPNDWYSSTHKGQLTIDWLGNFGGWGGAGYFDQLLSHRWEYTELLGDLFRFGQFQAYCFMLRGGGAIYHFASDLNVLPEVYYNQELLHAGSNTYAPAPSTTVNSERILYAKLGNASFGNLLAYSGQFTALKSRLGNFGGLTAETIAALAIATNHLQAGSVTVDKVGANAITAEKIAALAIATNHLQAGAVTVDKVSANAITAEKIAALAIATNHLQAGAVTVDKVGANAITATKIAALAIATNHLQAGAVTVDKVSANAITAEKIAALAIATNHLQAGAVTVDKVGANAITAEKIAALAIATNHLQAGAVTADKITADTALIQKLIANVGLFNQLQAQLGVFGGLGANSIAANSITTKHLTIANTDNICTNPKFANGSNEGWTSNVTVLSTSTAAEWGSNYVGLINNYRDTYFNYGKPFNVQHGDSYFISCYAYHYLNPNSDFRLGLQVSYSDGSVNWLTFLARSASDRGGINFASGTIKTLDVSGKKIVSAMLFLQMLGTTGAMGGGYYFSNVYLRKMASSELIVDGAITTQKILSKAITTDKIAANAVTATELLADTALINKLVATSALFDSLVARLAVFGGLTANSIASDAILGRHIKAGEKISSPIIEGGEVRLIGTAFMKVQSATAFGPDGLVEWYGPKLLLNGAPDWANLRKSNAITYLAANGDAYFGGSLSAGVLKTGVTNTDKNPYAANSYPVQIGPFSTNGKAKVIVISFRLNGVSTASSQPNNPTQPQLSWQLQRKIGTGSWVTVSSGVFTGTTSAEYESEPPAHWITFEGCNGSSTYTDNTVSTSDFSYRILVVSYSRFHATANITNQSLSLISTEQ